MPIPEDIRIILEHTGKSKEQFIKVFENYSGARDTLKRNAAYFLIRSMEGHTYNDPPYLQYYNDVLAQSTDYDNKKDFINTKFDSLNQIYSSLGPTERPDYNVITSEMLIENIDYAFKAWEMPWARSLSYDEFCRYILPYKVSVEKPTFWRKQLYEQFHGIVDSLPHETDRKKVCAIINERLKWFKFQWPFNYPGVLDFNNMLLGKTGKCADATALTAYAMRSVGIPVVIDYTDQWANRNYGHTWNSVMYQDKRFVSFQGTETNPGEAKIEYDFNEDWIFKRAKIFRRSFTKSNTNKVLLEQSDEAVPYNFHDEFHEDITADFVPVADITVDLNKEVAADNKRFSYLCVFNNENWVPVDWGERKGQSISFKNAGKTILYIVASYSEAGLFYLTPPFTLSEDGRLVKCISDKIKKRTVRLTRKYPYNNSNNIKTGDQYELMQWQDGWKSLGFQIAKDSFLTYSNIPENALLILHDLSRGKQERPFTISGNKQIFW